MQKSTEPTQTATTGKARRTVGLALSLVAFVISILAVEIVLRMVPQLGSNAALGVPSLYRIPHPVFGWALQPGATYVNPMPEGRVTVRINSEGWRDLERSRNRRDGSFRIIVLGDSFMEAYSVEMNDAFHRRLENLLEIGNRDIEVLNFGVGGYGTLQEYLVYRDVAKSFDPDLVLLGFCVANDVRNNYEPLEERIGSLTSTQESRPYLTDAPEWEIRDVDVSSARRAYESARAERSSTVNRLLETSMIYRLARKAVNRLQEQLRTTPDDSLQRDLAINGVHYCEITPEYERAWEVTGRILERLETEVEATGATLVVFTEPTHRETSDRIIQRIKKNSPDESKLCLEAAPGNERLDALLEDLQIPLIDLLPAFRQASEAGRTLFHASDHHWTKAGNSLAAGVVASALEQLKIFDLTEKSIEIESARSMLGRSEAENATTGGAAR